MKIDQLFEFGACLWGHSIWVGFLAAFTYWLLGCANSRLQPATKVWTGLCLLLAVPMISTLFAAAGIYKLPLAHRVSISVPGELLTTIAVIWGAGMLICLLRFITGTVQINFLVKAGRVEPDLKSIKLIGEFRKRFSIPKRPHIDMNNRVSAPFFTGTLSPRIVLPTALRKADPGCLDCVLVHELAHFFRKDTWFLLLQKTVDAMFFYHPAMRWLSGDIRSERERACDDLAVVMLGGNRMSYASALLAAESATSSRMPMALAFGRESTAERASRIAFGSPANSGRPGNVSLAILLFLTMLVGGWSVLSLVEVRFSLAKSDPVLIPDQVATVVSVDSIPGINWSTVPLIETHWKDRVLQGREVPVFRSVPLIEKGGLVIDLTKEEPRLFPEVPNQWLLQYRVDYLDSRMLSKDPDGDLFTTLEEFQAGTSPDSERSHPDRITLLSFYGLEYEVYRIQFRASPDHKTAQLTRTPSARHQDRQNFYVKVGDTTRDGRVLLENISQQGISIRDLKSGQVFELQKKQIAELRTHYATLKMRGGKLFHVEEGASFYVPGDGSEKWALLKVTEKTCQVESSAGEITTFSRQPPRKTSKAIVDLTDDF